MRHIVRALFVCVFAFLVGSVGIAQDKPVPADKQININTASVEQLESLPGIGRATAQRIVEYREKNGGFKKPEELMNVRGIGEKSFLRLKPMIAVQGKTDKPTGQQ